MHLEKRGLNNMQKPRKYVKPKSRQVIKIDANGISSGVLISGGYTVKEPEYIKIEFQDDNLTKVIKMPFTRNYMRRIAIENYENKKELSRLIKALKKEQDGRRSLKKFLGLENE